MHLVKWIRKNMGKLMAVFVIVIMIAFIMPSLLNELAKPSYRDQNSAMYTYGDGLTINRVDLQNASVQLQALRGLMIDRLLPALGDVRSVLLGQLLFPESENAAMVSDELKNAAMQSGLRINPSVVDEFFKQSRGRAELFFVLLRYEAEKAGCAVTGDTAGNILKSVIPQLTNNQVDAATLVRNLSASTNMSDEQILKSFADILAIMSYSRVVTDTENLTMAQLENTFARMNERMDVNLVEFAAEDFVDKAPQPSEAEVIGMFEKFKNNTPGVTSDENPVGFGYKLPPRVAIDYMMIKVSDLKKNVAPPTEEEVEEFYRQNLERPPITEEVPEDPNDPNSKTIKKQKSYAEVADMIKKGLHTRKINAQGTKILSEAMEQTDSAFESIDFEKASVETLKAKAGDYAGVAENISKQYNIKVYNGRTSLLTAADFQSDLNLGRLVIAGQSRMPTRLIKLIFAVKELGDEATKMGPFEPTAPKMFVSAGPLTDMAGDIIAIVRVVDAAKSAAPDSVDFSYVKNLPNIGEPNLAKDKFVLKDEVIKDCKKLAAAQIADKAANEFLGLVKNQNWDAALAKLNSEYGKKNADPNEKTFKMQSMDSLKRVSAMDIEQTKMRVAGMMGAESIIDQSLLYAKLVDTFYNEFEQMQAKNQQPPVLIDFDPKLTLYVVESFDVGSPGTQEEFDSIRLRLALQEDFIDAQSAAFGFYMPDNITARVNLKEVVQPKAADANDTNDANGAK
ncbi:MAG: hypothetical protein A2Y12_00745 [Planctomycetes bacterium GWF2_42_9]|nr:MAG: hypothetical protein A2Y12_00745 [Planctomycetes bacterium GWF2_42_9]HAL44750.1 hypothetical protein [Phycisphaerales bacterium]